MTRIVDLIDRRFTVSVECFPPKTDAGVAQLDEALDALGRLRLDFASVTYGAGGSTRTFTRDLVVRLTTERPYPVMAHLTCIGHARAQIEELLDDYQRHGVDNILALAGDPPADGTEAGGDFAYASELVAEVRRRGSFGVAVAAFPEVHPRSPDRASDRRHLADKLAAADFGVTQFFFDAEQYLRLRDELAALGCSTPVVPGIMPLLNTTTIRRFATMNGASFPEDLAARIDAARDEHEVLDLAVEAAVDLCRRLVAEGVPGLHFYCLNRATATLAIVDALGVRKE